MTCVWYRPRSKTSLVVQKNLDPREQAVAMNTTATTTVPVLRVRKSNASRRKYRNVDVRDSLQFANVDKFFSVPENFAILYSILNNTNSKTAATAEHLVKQEPVKVEPVEPGQPATIHQLDFPQISLRTLEHLCTNYTHKQAATYTFQGQTHSVDYEYQRFLTTHGKAKFDVFRRSPDRTFIKLEKFGKTIYTTLCQLLFFRAAIQYGILHYAVRHRASIEEDMADRLKEQRQSRRRRRRSSSREPDREPGPDDMEVDGTETAPPATPSTEVRQRLNELTLNEPKRLKLSE